MKDTIVLVSFLLVVAITCAGICWVAVELETIHALWFLLVPLSLSIRTGKDARVKKDEIG